MLWPVEVNSILKIKSYKQNLVWSGGSSGGKVVLILLTEIIAFYLGSTTVDVKGFDLEIVSK